MKDQESIRWRSGWLLGALLASAASSGCSAAAVPAEEPGAAPAAPGEVDQAPPAGGGNLIKNGTFEDGTSLPWTTSFSAPADGKASIDKGALCLEVTNKGDNSWDAQIRHREMVLQKGHSYAITFRARASAATKVRPKVGMAGPPYAEYWAAVINLTPKMQTFTGHFKMKGDDDPTSELTFHMGGNLAGASVPFTVCVDDVRLEDPEYKAPVIAKVPPPPKVRVNQVGYFPGLAKRAVLVNTSPAPLAWEILNVGGTVVEKGMTVFSGPDTASGETVHFADFSAFKQVGSGYKLRVSGDESPPFAVGRDLYKKLKYDALSYFYHNRSGIPITMPFAGEEKWARPAGHLSDKSVPCAPGTGCSYSLDVAGGWYDAGDHGKYVVNGGISVWTLLNQYERAKFIGTSSGDFADGKLTIPENKNGVPDILDEARWELEFLLKMQVPAGNPLAGMVHHKIHDEKWTALGMAPHEDVMKRFLRAPSTAATLNLAATAAQGARIWKTIDPAFSAKCLAAAERAWAAAQANPAVYALGSDNSGGGPYDDKNVTDEVFWAAAELFATTGKDVYKEAVVKSPLFKVIPGPRSGAGASMTWQDTQALGAISLALVPGGLDAASVAAVRASIVAVADAYLDVIETQGYRLPMKPGGGNKYPWGSNSLVLNNLIILSLAHDFTGNVKYINGVVEGMDYILGRNPLSQSFVTGYGERALKNPHHRFWSHQVNEKFPVAPPGAVSGGPNSGLEDPYVKAAGLSGCAPQKCFVDNIEAWSVNEITINWNAPLAWVAAYLDEKGK
jgi:endoglucanase